MNRSRNTGRISTSNAIIIAAIFAAVGLWAGNHWFATMAPPTLQTAILYPQSRALPEFQLTQADGRPLTLADWRGHWTVAFFGYTNCPDICPITLAAFKQAWAKLGSEGKTANIRFAFISVDPQRDTPEVLGRYVGFFSKDFTAATGPDEQLLPLTRALGLVYAREPEKDGTYAVDHSTSAVIINPDGREVGLFRPPLDGDKIASDLIALQATTHQ